MKFFIILSFFLYNKFLNNCIEIASVSNTYSRFNTFHTYAAISNINKYSNNDGNSIKKFYSVNLPTYGSYIKLSSKTSFDVYSNLISNKYKYSLNSYTNYPTISPLLLITSNPTFYPTKIYDTSNANETSNKKKTRPNNRNSNYHVICSNFFTCFSKWVILLLY